MKANKK
jgi:hypothetical protein